jgi:Bacterial regulatory proteins, luxR family
VSTFGGGGGPVTFRNLGGVSTTAVGASDARPWRRRDLTAAVVAGAMLWPRCNADVGRVLVLSEATVKAHVSRLLTKLDAASRIQVAIRAHDAGLFHD